MNVLINYGQVIKLLDDTDSFFLNIETEDIYKDMKLMQDDLDTSNYSSDHFLYSIKF